MQQQQQHKLGLGQEGPAASQQTDVLAFMSHQLNNGTVGIHNIGNAPIGCSGVRHICPRNYPFPLTDP